jgi:hypothetical protein
MLRNLVRPLPPIGLGLGLLLLLMAPVYAGTPPKRPQRRLETSGSFPAATGGVSGQATFPSNPLNTPTQGNTVTNPKPAFDWDDADGPVISYTLLITGPDTFAGVLGPSTTAAITTTGSGYTSTQIFPNGVYTWTVQAHNGAEVSGYVAPYTFTLEALWQVYLPLVQKAPACPSTSGASFERIPFEGAPTDHPDYLHGDLNLDLRGYSLTGASLGLVDYGNPPEDSPQLAGLFQPNRGPDITSAYRVNSWEWDPARCGGNPHGCPGTPLTTWDVTLMGLATTPGESVYIPERNASIYQGVYKALVLYAEERRITLAYTREDTVANGYAVHIENLCVDPNLLALYQAQTDAGGWHVTGHLPALRNDQALGTALGGQILVAVRDRGSFMDPRAKDWWTGY